MYVSSLAGDYVSALSAVASSGEVVEARMDGKEHFLFFSKIENTPLAVVLAASRTMLIVAIVLFCLMTSA